MVTVPMAAQDVENDVSDGFLGKFIAGTMPIMMSGSSVSLTTNTAPE